MTENFPRLVTQSDIIRRWVYTREGVRRVIRNDPNFPKPVTTVNGGRTPLWMTSDIEDYERKRPWLKDEQKKKSRVIHFLHRSMYRPS